MDILNIPYDKLQITRRFTRYDGIYWRGTCLVDGVEMKYVVHDETDYNKPCPYCDDDNEGDITKCVCENYTDLWCYVYPITLWEKVKLLLGRTI